MVDLDLGALSAPVESLRSDVEAAYDALDKKWERISETLRSLPIPVDVCFVFAEDLEHPTDCDSLEWRKWNGKWRICIVSSSMHVDRFGEPCEDEDVTPYEEWGAKQRISMLEHVPDLFKAAAEQTQKFIDSVKD